MGGCQTHLPPSGGLSPILGSCLPVSAMGQHPMPSRKQLEYRKKLIFKVQMCFIKTTRL